ncbi:MAG: helix-turn-helix transcriptional regulator [Clostridia bacterium]|nr:helix-turn-helix transcriptional regulator [Clostridia bacterium]
MENVFSDILVKISDLLQKQNKTQKELCDYLGINGNVYTAWKNGRNKSYTKHLPKIAQFFEISVETLLGKEKSPAGAELEEKDRLLIEAYHRAEPVIQSTVDKLLGIDEREMVTLKIAARGGSGNVEEREITKEQWEQIKKATDLKGV